MYCLYKLRLAICNNNCLPCRDAEGAGVAHLVHLHQGSCGEWQPRQRPDQIITNPPWGNRLMGAEADDSSALEATWTELGLFLKVSTSLQHPRRIDTPL